MKAEVESGRRQLGEAQKEIARLTRELSAAVAAAAESAGLKAEVESGRQRLSEAQMETARLTKELAAAVAAAAGAAPLKAEVESGRRQLGEAQKEIARLTRELSAAVAAAAESAGLKAEVESGRQRLSEAQMETARLTKELAAASAAAGKAAPLKAEVESGRQQLTVAEGEIVRLRQELAAAAAAAEGVDALEVRLVEEQRRRTAVEDAAAVRERDLSDRLDEISKRAEALSVELNNSRRALARERASIESLRLEAARLERAPAAPRVAPAGWRLRLGDGSVYGPVPIAELAEWAAECRIGPEHMLSRDGATWVPSAEVPELGMNWTVRLADGSSYGPVNLLSVPELVAQGVVAPDAAVRQVAGDVLLKARDVSGAVVAAVCGQWRRMAGEVERLSAALAEATARVPAAERPPAPSAGPLPGLPPRTVRRDVSRHRL
ncbi:MAG: hypothetical protein FJ225_11060 [Lentisphaerae bacterium]|nr:hypothetical protein [Lentisphaerota bacterium]